MNKYNNVQLLFAISLGIIIFWFWPVGHALGQERSLVTTFSIGERYDDNIHLSGLNKEDDLITSLQSHIILGYASQLTQLRVDYKIEPEFYQNKTRLNNTRHHGTLSLISQLRPWLRAGLTDNLTITEDVDRELDERGLRFQSTTSRARKQTNRLSFFLEPQFTGRLSLKMNFDTSLDDVGISSESDEQRNAVTLGLNYITDTGRNNIASLSYRFSKYTFESNRDGNRIQDTDNDFQTHSVFLGYSHNFSPSLSANIHAGVSQRSSGESNEDNNGAEFMGGLGITKSWRQAQLALNYNRDIGSGGGQGGSTSYQMVNADFNYAVSPILNWGLRARLSQNDFQGSRNSSGGDSTYWFADFHIDYQPFHWWEITSGYNYSRRDGSRDSVQGEGGRKLYQSPHLVFNFFLGRYWEINIGYTYARNTSKSDRDNDDYDRTQVWFNVNFILDSKI